MRFKIVERRPEAIHGIIEAARKSLVVVFVVIIAYTFPYTKNDRKDKHVAKYAMKYENIVYFLFLSSSPSHHQQQQQKRQQQQQQHSAEFCFSILNAVTAAATATPFPPP